MTDPAATPEPIVAVIPEGTWCPHCNSPYHGEHEHRWQPPTRCTATFDANDDGLGRCERDAGHDAGPFPRAAWNSGHQGVGRWITDPTPHVVTWGP